jgi:putative FmdB family regulatory protein
MPIREYNCKCGKEFEQLVGMHEEVKCPDCDKKVSSIISRTSFILKGSGWSCSGYSKENNNKKETGPC